jgi:hypothetical protein
MNIPLLLMNGTMHHQQWQIFTMRSAHTFHIKQEKEQYSYEWDPGTPWDY